MEKEGWECRETRMCLFLVGSFVLSVQESRLEELKRKYGGGTGRRP